MCPDAIGETQLLKNVCDLLLYSLECLVQILDDVIDMLCTDGQTDGTLGDTYVC